MRTYKKILSSLLICSSLSVTSAFAAHVSITNNTHDPIKVFMRGEGVTHHHRVEMLAAHASNDYTLTDTDLLGKPFFEVIASTGTGDNPDWILLAGECKHLDKDGKYTLKIETTKMGLKTSCKVVK